VDRGAPEAVDAELEEKEMQWSGSTDLMSCAERRNGSYC
jgi:hypothetical protein